MSSSDTARRLEMHFIKGRQCTVTEHEKEKRIFNICMISLVPARDLRAILCVPAHYYLAILRPRDTSHQLLTSPAHQ